MPVMMTWNMENVGHEPDGQTDFQGLVQTRTMVTRASLKGIDPVYPEIELIRASA